MLRTPLREAIRSPLRPALRGAVPPISEAAAYSPLAIGAQLLLWLDGQDASALLDTSGGTAVANGGSVGRWTDKSGTGRHADQSTGSAQPVRDDAAIGAYRGLTFDGGDSQVVPSLGALTQLEIWMVASFGAGTQILAENYEGGSAFFVLYSDGSHWLGELDDGDADVSIAASAGTPAVVRLVVDMTLASGAKVLEVNGSSVAGGANANVGVPVAANPLYLGQRYTGTLGLDGSIGEVVAVSGLLTTDQATALRTYLNARWGLS